MKKLIIIMVILLISLPLFAQNAVIKEISGRVEIQNPGGRWQSASVGDELPKGSSISTGFGSSAVLEAGDSVLTVDALTRIKLEELLQSQDAQTTALFLRVGKVKAEVKRDRSLSHDFRLRSPSSTAAVRGTKFEYNGNVLEVEEGTVSFFSAALGRDFRVTQGQLSRVMKSGKQSSALVEAFKESMTDGSVVMVQDSTAQGGDGSSGLNSFSSYRDWTNAVKGSVTITVVE